MKYLLLMVLATVLVCGGCSNGSSSSDGGTTDTDTDTDTDGDTDADTDSDTDTNVGCCDLPTGITDWGGPCHTTADCPLNTVCIILDLDEIDQTQGFCAVECCNFSTANAEHCTDVASGQEGCQWGMTSDEGITWDPPFYCLITCDTVADCPLGTGCVDTGRGFSICHGYAPATDAGVDGGP